MAAASAQQASHRRSPWLWRSAILILIVEMASKPLSDFCAGLRSFRGMKFDYVPQRLLGVRPLWTIRGQQFCDIPVALSFPAVVADGTHQEAV